MCPHLQHELQIMSRLNHPNIVRVYGGSMSPPNLFVVEEIMVGDLATHIHKRNGAPLTLRMALVLAHDIIRGLVRSHSCINDVQVLFFWSLSSSTLNLRPTYMTWTSSIVT